MSRTTERPCAGFGCADTAVGLALLCPDCADKRDELTDCIELCPESQAWLDATEARVALLARLPALRDLLERWTAAGLTAALEYVVGAASECPVACVRFVDRGAAVVGLRIARDARRDGAALGASKADSTGTLSVCLDVAAPARRLDDAALLAFVADTGLGAARYAAEKGHPWPPAGWGLGHEESIRGAAGMLGVRVDASYFRRGGAAWAAYCAGRTE